LQEKPERVILRCEAHYQAGKSAANLTLGASLDESSENGEELRGGIS